MAAPEIFIGNTRVLMIIHDVVEEWKKPRKWYESKTVFTIIVRKRKSQPFCTNLVAISQV
jgi:hypothetical protein